MKAKIITLFAVWLIILQAVIPAAFIKDASAYQSHPENFSTDYTLIGDIREDIVSVARAQFRKSQDDMGYTESWCADFVGDCAKLANIPDWPALGNCNDLLRYLRDTKGCTWHTYDSDYVPQKGDLVFFSKYGNTSDDSTHVAIIYSDGFDSEGRIYTVEGNTGNGYGEGSFAMIKKRTVTEESTMYVLGYIELTERPQYTGVPENLRISVTPTSIRLGQTVNISCEASSADRLFINVYHNNSRSCAYSGCGNTAAFSPDRLGYHEVLVTAQNENGSTEAVKFIFYVTKADSHTLSVSFCDGVTGEIFCVSEVVYGRDVIFPIPPQHEGFSFTGWDSEGREIKKDVTITALYEKASSPSDIAVGDCNNDGKINTSDAVLVLKSSAGMINLESDVLAAADTNRDGKVNTSDAVLILKYAAGMITEF